MEPNTHLAMYEEFQTWAVFQLFFHNNRGPLPQGSDLWSCFLAHNIFLLLSHPALCQPNVETDSRLTQLEKVYRPYERT